MQKQKRQNEFPSRRTIGMDGLHVSCILVSKIHLLYLVLFHVHGYFFVVVYYVPLLFYRPKETIYNLSIIRYLLLFSNINLSKIHYILM